MSKHKQQEQPDRHLEAPAEANRDKHINFIAEEEKRGQRTDTRSDNSENTSLKNRRKNNNRE